jgi:hypothetical protein
MRKLAFIVAVLFLAATTYGQTKTDASKGQQKQTAKTEQAKTGQKSATATTTATTTTTGPLKKDGTADKRYKANKEVAKPAGPVKKDGTPDMRYKDNKTAKTVKK